ncbi:MAG: tetratricopeptide repeat protein [Bdellovibrionales bacterium]|nr:tetratricopeptide repeat protein [Bdellovibrionales bacterium]
MELNDQTEILNEASAFFKKGELKSAEPLINQLILDGHKSAEVFHMLGTILYDQGKFNKAIRSFRRALELDPFYTDASIGLSIILNDLGRYEEGRKVFEEAQVMLAQKSAKEDPYIEEKLAIKHDELGELYCQYRRYDEGLEQYERALQLSSRVPELTMKIVDCLENLNRLTEAEAQLKSLVKTYPDFFNARTKLGKIYYEQNKIPEAIDAWENVLSRDPNHAQAKKLLAQAQNIEFIPAQEPYL